MQVSEDKKALLKKLLLENAKKSQLQEFALSFGQEALWFIHQNAPENAAYNIAFTVRIRSALNVEAFRKACQQLIKNLLRQTVEPVDDNIGHA